MSHKVLAEACQCTCGQRYCAGNRGTTDWPVELETPLEVRVERTVMRQRDRSKKLNDKKQRESVDRVRRYRTQWTSVELGIICRTDITIAEMCALTGRTFQAVRTMRKRLRREKALQAVAS